MSRAEALGVWRTIGTQGAEALEAELRKVRRF